MKECTQGVALAVTNPRGKVLILREFENKPRLGKYVGMFSIPMETCEEGDNDLATLKKLCEQELPGLTLPLPGEYVGAYRVVPGVWVRLYTTMSTTDALPTASCHMGEVGEHQWMSPHEATGLWLRRGALEMIQDYTAGRRGIRRRECSDVQERVLA